MKKLFLLILLVAQGATGAFGQYLVSPIKKVIPNHNYTVSELKNFINSDDPIVGPWCETFLGLVQDGLTKCNEDLFIVKGHGDSRQTALYIIDNYCIETVRDLDVGFENSGKTLNNEIKFVVDKREFKSMIFLTFKFGSCEKDIVKMNCFNTPNLVERKIYVSPPEPVVVSNPVIQDETPAPTERRLTVQQALKWDIEKNVSCDYRKSTKPVVLLNKRGWVLPVCIIGGVTVTIGVSYLIYSLVRNHGVIETRTMPNGQE